jgi:hypothetical protein
MLSKRFDPGGADREKGGAPYRAAAGEKQSHGKAVGEALDALTARLSDAEATTLVVVQSLRLDRFSNVT